MKGIFHVIVLAIATMAFATAQGQVCSPDTMTYPNSGIYPAELPPACTNQLYEAVITVNVPVDTMPPGIPLTVPINWIQLDSVIGLPPGFTAACAPANCQFPGNSSGCVIISGTPMTAPDTFVLDFAVTVEVNFGGPIAIPSTLEDYYTLIVRAGPQGSVVSQTNASCTGAMDGGFSITASGGVGPLEFSIDGGTTWTTDTVFTGLTDGPYDVLIADSAGCITTLPVTVETDLDPIAFDTVEVAQITCFGENDGAIGIEITGGNANFSISWNTTSADTTPSIDNLGPGTYIVTIADTNGCSKEEEFVIEEPDPLTLSASATNDNGTSNGTATATAGGGTPSYEYLWSNGATTDSIFGLEAGEYIVTVTDEFGCTISDTVEVVSVVGIEEQLFSKFELYPNPSDGTFTLTFDLEEAEELQIDLLNMKGQSIWQDRTNRILQYQQQIRVDETAAGMYLLKVSSKHSVFTHKVLIH